MNSMGLILPILIAFCVGTTLLICLIDKWTESKGSYEKWLEEELKRNPRYINWLKTANNGKDYRLGKKILRKIKKGGKGH